MGMFDSGATVRAYVASIQTEAADPRGFFAMLVILAAFIIEHDPALIARFLDAPAAEVEVILDRLYKEGLLGRDGPPFSVLLDRSLLLGCASVATGDAHYRPGSDPPFVLSDQGRQLARRLLQQGEKHA